MSLPYVGGSGDDSNINPTKQNSDPQVIFYIRPTSQNPATQRTLDDSRNSILPTIHIWAAKIEHTIWEKVRDKGVLEYGTEKASWDRAAYRVELIDHVARTSPWMMVIRNNEATFPEQELTGEYYHDKQIYQKFVHDFMQDIISNALAGESRVIERYISETLVLGQGKSSNVRRFAIVVPSTNTGSFDQPGIRLKSLSFERSIDNDGRATVTASSKLCEARLNKEMLDGVVLDSEILQAGERIVLDATVRIMMNG